MKLSFHILAFIFGIFYSVSAFSQQDSVVKFSDLKFYSYLEEQAFHNFKEGKPDFLTLLLGIDPGVDSVQLSVFKNELEKATKNLMNRKFERSREDKKVEKVYEFVSTSILNKYKEETLFPDVFNSGRFNCLTASAYYGLIFLNLHINFAFEEKSDHIHPIAYPQTLQISIEPTNLQNGYQYFDLHLKTQFVNYLLNSNLVSKEEYKELTVDQIFNKFYFPDKRVGMLELTGLQYLNDALFNFKDGYF